MTHQLTLLPGDTVGPELIRQVSKVLTTIVSISDLSIRITECPAGGDAIKQYKTPIPEETVVSALNSDAVILGNIGATCYQHMPLDERPEYALLELRKKYQVCTNLRPVFVRKGLETLSPLKSEFLRDGLDILLVRDIQGGMITGPRNTFRSKQGYTASDLELYNEKMVLASGRIAFDAALQRTRKLTSLDKANVLVSSSLWRNTVTDLARQYPEVALNHQYIDSAAMNVIKSPGEYDVILTSNVFGDILSDELAQLTGTPNFFGSTELAETGKGIYTPNQLHHPNEKLAGQNIVCPVGILNATAMMLNYSLHRLDLSRLLQEAIDHLFTQKLTTPEIPIEGFQQISTDEIGTEVANYLLQHISHF